MNKFTAIILSSALLLSACGPADNDPPKLFESQREVLDKAKAVESMQLEQVEKQRKEMEEQTR